MLNDASCFKQVYIVTGYTDLRSGIDRLAALVQSHLGDHCFEPDTIYLFCGRKTDRTKDCSGKMTAIFFCINVLKQAVFNGREQNPKSAD